MFYSATHCITINRSELIISPLGQLLQNEGNHFIHPDDSFILFAEQKIMISRSTSPYFEVNLNKAFVDADQLIFPLVVRFWQDGDKFMPLGMTQSKKISDFLIGQKIPLPHKSKIPLLINGNGEIIWVAGLRQDNRYKVNTTTKKVVIFELSNQ